MYYRPLPFGARFNVPKLNATACRHILVLDHLRKSVAGAVSDILRGLSRQGYTLVDETDMNRICTV